MIKSIIFILFAPAYIFPQIDYVITGELRQWHGIQITFEGPSSAENSDVNPFTDYRLDVLFAHYDTSYLVPGYYAADGNASQTSASSGNKWRVIFTPDRTGEWSFIVSFRKGSFIAVDTVQDAGEPASFDGVNGIFTVSESNKSAPDFRSKGMLLYNGSRYLQFSGSKKYFIKGGSNSPENFLAYEDFDQTPSKHSFQAHINDWKVGNPLWQNNKGSSIIGAINYLSTKGLNSLYMLTFNVNGDGNDIWPYTNRDERFRFDCSKLDQWNIAFSHMQSKGILCHFVTQETENDHELDSGNLGNQRKLYYRELIARFGYHPAVIWNLGEEITNSTEQIKDFAKYIRDIDPYDHFITMHNISFRNFEPLLGTSHLDGPSMYIYDIEDVNADTKKYINESEKAGRIWVCFLDEIGPFDKATPPDQVDFWHDDLRKQVLWGHLMAGGAGLEWYMGYDYPHNDLTLEDFRSRDQLWNLTNNALHFFKKHLPFAEMLSRDDLINSGNHCLAKENEMYALYLPNGGGAYIELPDTDPYYIRWYNPRTGGELENGSKNSISGSGRQFIGQPPREAAMDWAVIISKSTPGTDGTKLKFHIPFSSVLNDTSQKIKINIKVLDDDGNPSKSTDPIIFQVNGPGFIFEGDSVIPINGNAAITFVASIDTGETNIKAIYQNVTDSIMIRTVTQLVIDDFEDYLSTTELTNEWMYSGGFNSSVKLDDVDAISGRNSLMINYNPDIQSQISVQKYFSQSYSGSKYLSFRLRMDISRINLTISLNTNSRKWTYDLPVSFPGESLFILPLHFFKNNGDSSSIKISEITSLQINISGSQEAGKIWFDSFLLSTTEVIINNVDTDNPEYYLLQNYPNPFNKTTNIRFNLPGESNIKVSVYDVLGNLVQVIFDGIQSAGEHNIQWNAENVTSGIYMIRLETGDFVKSIKSILLK